MLIQFFALLLLSAWMSAASARAMQVTISATPDPAVAGEQLIYTVAYRNVTGNACPKANLHFTLPQHVGSDSGTTRSWSLGTLPGGRHGSKTVRVTVDSPLPPNTELKTRANVTSTGSVTCQTTVTDETNVRPALQVIKTSSVDTVDAGDQLVYTLHYDNAGKGSATNVILKDTLPGNVSFASATGSHTESGNIVTWNLGTLIAGAKGSVTLTVDVDSPLDNGTVLTNSGTINSTETDPSPFSLDVNVHSEPVLTLTKTASKDPVSPGDHLHYTLHYENSGTAEATNLVLKDTLPVGVIFDSASNGGSLNGNVVTWNLADLAPNHSGDLTLAVIVDSSVVNGHILENSATLDSTETQLVTALKDVVVLAEPAFEIIKTASKDPVNPGDDLTYTINFRNIGSGQGTGIIIEDTLPTGVAFQSASPGHSVSGGKVTWNLAALSAGASGSVTLTVTVNSPLGEGTILLNTVSMVSAETAPHKVTDVIDVTVHSEPVLKLTKTSSRDPVKAGEELIYTIAYENVGTGAATHIILEDDLPAGVTFKSATAGGSLLSGKVTWNLGALSAGASGSVGLTVTVKSPLANGTVLHNVTTIDSAETPHLSDFDDVIVSSTAALELTKTASKAIVNPGDELVYTIAYENVGSDQATHVILEDILPVGVTFKSASNSGSLTGGFVRWDLGTVAAGASGSVILTVTVGNLADGALITNVANIASHETPNPVQDQIQTPVLSEPVLELNKTASATLVKPGDQVLYTIEYKNIGTGDATDVVITDTLPSDVTYGYSLPQATISGGVVTWPPTTLQVGATKSVTVAAFVNSPLTDGTVLHNPASIKSNETARLSSSFDITVLSEPVLELNKTASKTQVSPGDELTYTIEYKNVGTDMATGVKLEDQLPGNVTFISATNGGTETGAKVSWDLGSIPAGGTPGTVSVKVRVNMPLSDGTILQNPANIHSNETQPVSTIANVTVLSHPRLGLIKTAARDHVKPGEELVYTIEYQNSGTDQATLVTLEDHIPGDVTFVSATGSPTVSNGIVHWDIGTMPAGAPAGSVTVRVRINDPLPNGTVIHNSASIKGKNAPSVTSQAPVSVISAPVLKLTKKASADPVLPGDSLTYTLEYSNEGTDQATGVKLEDQLPGEVTFVSASGNGTLSGSVVSWDLGSISPGGTPGSVFVKVKVNNPLENDIVLHNLASISSTEHAQASSSVEVTVNSAPVLELNKTASKTHVNPGDTITYDIDYKNTGNDQAIGVKLEDHLPSDVTFISASAGANVSGNVVSWDLGSMPAGGAPGSVFIKVTVNNTSADGTILNNTASIFSTKTQPVLASALVTVYSKPVLELNKTASLSHVNPGDTLLYTLEYKNTGTGQATGVILEDHIPGDVTFASATGTYTESGGVVSWNLGTMQAGALTGSVTVKVRINDPLSNGTVLHNLASIKSIETLLITSQADVSVISAPVLKLTKSASKNPVLPGDTLEYRLDYKNVGTDQATGVKLEDHLPGDLIFVSASGGGTESAGIVTWNLSPISVGQTGSKTVTVTVNNSAANGTVLHNPATLESTESQPAKAAVDVTVESTPVLELTKTASTNPVAPGTTLSYTLDYKNIGNAQASGVILEDHLPVDVSFVSASDGGTESGGIVRWNPGSVPAGTSRSVSLTVLVNSNLNNGVVLQNSATITSNETHPFSASADVTVGAGPALTLIKTASSDPVAPGDNLVYTIEYKNVGSSPATSVVLEDDLPPGADFVSATQGGVNSAGKVIWNLGTLPGGASGKVAITVTINNSLTDGTVLDNAATIDSVETHPVSTQLDVTVLGSRTPPSITPVPTLGTWMMLMLSLLLFAIASYFITRRKT